MSEIRRADHGARRKATLLVLVGAVVGALALLAFAPFAEWLASQPGEMAHRIKLVFFLAGIILSAPLIAFAGYFWTLGASVLRAHEFPPPGYGLARDTPIVKDRAAIRRGRALQALALFLAAACVLLLMLLWELGSAFHEGVF